MEGTFFVKVLSSTARAIFSSSQMKPAYGYAMGEKSSFLYCIEYCSSYSKYKRLDLWVGIRFTRFSDESLSKRLEKTVKTAMDGGNAIPVRVERGHEGQLFPMKKDLKKPSGCEASAAPVRVNGEGDV